MRSGALQLRQPADVTPGPMKAPHVTLLYHYFHPDDVVSARQFSDLAEGLAARGWSVTAMPATRGCRDESQSWPRHETWGCVNVDRVWRPNWRQASSLGRLANAVWMIVGWGLRGVFATRREREAMVVGTDPVLAVLTAIAWRLFRPKCAIIHWCHDLYPEAPIADGMMRADSFSARVLRRVLAAAYRCCDVIADLGPCMRDLLAKYGSPARQSTLTPWALVEPSEVLTEDPATRRELFGDARVGMLYSGSFGRAHSHAEFLALARALQADDVQFCFAGRGNRMDTLRAAVTAEDANVSFAGFAPEAELEKRLAACDMHLVSLRAEWTGTVVPSKFFGALAIGRAVVYAGAPESAIARWIEEHRVGWVLSLDSAESVATKIRELCADPLAMRQLRERCHRVYHEHFAREVMIEHWDAVLHSAIDVRWSAQFPTLSDSARSSTVRAA